MFDLNFINKYPKINELKSKLKEYHIAEIKSYEEYLKAFKVYDMRKYEKYFVNVILYRGADLFYAGKLNNYKKFKSMHFCNLSNNGNSYKVMVKLNKENEIIDSSCDCLYRKNNGNMYLCKHIGALLFKIHQSIDIEELKSKLLEQLDEIKLILNDTDYIIKNEFKYFKKEVLKQLKQDYENLLSLYNNELNHVNAYKTEQLMVLSVRGIDVLIKEIVKRLTASLENKILERGLIIDLNVKIENNIPVQVKHNNNLVNLSNLFYLNNKINKDKNTIWDSDLHGLEDWQKELVKKGEYDSWSFEEEELEEDDYYYEDN